MCGRKWCKCWSWRQTSPMWVPAATGSGTAGRWIRKINNDKMKNEHPLSASSKWKNQATFRVDLGDQPSFQHRFLFLFSSATSQQHDKWDNKASVYRRFFLPPVVVGQATSPAEERQDVTVLYNKMTLGELQSSFSFNVSVIHLFPVHYIIKSF